MPAPDREVPTIFDAYLGVNTTIDPAQLPPNVLRRAQNWAPGLPNTLQRRRGCTLYQTLITGGIHAAFRTTHGGQHYTYVVASVSGGGTDAILVSINDGIF